MTTFSDWMIAENLEVSTAQRTARPVERPGVASKAPDRRL